MNDFELKIWRLHPQGITLRPAEKDLAGYAHPSGVKFCGPFTNANRYGFWVFPSMDIDFILHQDGSFEHKVITPWEDKEVDVIRKLIRPTDHPDNICFCQNFGGRAKVDFGRVEPNICQIWTGVILQTPPGWSLMVRSPINLAMNVPYRIQEGILETDWLTYDLWINVAVQYCEQWIQLRRDQWPPLAQLVPVPRISYDQDWQMSEQMIHRDDADGERIYTGWADYNYKKYIKKRSEKDKDPATYHRERSRYLRKLKEQSLELYTPGKSPKALPKRLIRRRK